MSEKFLLGRVAVVTGGRRGLGKAMAFALGEVGAKLALVDNESCADAVSEAKVKGIEAKSFTCDVSNAKNVEACAKEIVDHFGKTNILINAAGIVIRKTTRDLSIDEWDRVIGINLSGAFYFSKALIPHMRGQGYGRIINICSVMAHVSTADRVAYNASKAGLLAMTKSQALELAQDNITVVGISPGAFSTDMTAALQADPARNATFMDATPMRRWGEPEEIGKLARYLCSPDASYITGTDIVIDGGWLASGV